MRPFLKHGSYSVSRANFSNDWILWLNDWNCIVSRHATRGQARHAKRVIDWIAGNKRKP